jgi:MFS family permease
LSHDLIGAGIWSPIQATLIQRFSSDEKRGLDVGKVLAWGSIGAIFGPLIAGNLALISSKLPFFISGILIIIAVTPLLFLKLSRDEGAKAAA